MSKIALSGNASGTGTLTIAAPNTNSDFTLSLPATTAPILAGSGITLSASAPANTLVTTDAGNVGIGTSSPASLLHLANADPVITLQDTAGAGAVATIFSGTNGSLVLSADPANAGGVTSLQFRVDGTECARIDSSGNLLVNTTSAIASAGYLQVSGATSTQNGIGIKATGSGTQFLAGFYNSASTVVGSINTNGTTTAYSTSSDYRLKENIAPMTGALAKVAALKPVTYKWKADGSDSQGFIAHELQAVVPDCVTGEKDAVDAEGNPQYQGIDTSFLVATLTAALQEAVAEINSLKARLDAANL